MRALTVLHATEPATVYLSLWARVPGLTVADVDRALYDDRTLVKQLAMRRTLFVFPRDAAPGRLGERLGPGGRDAPRPAWRRRPSPTAWPTTARPGSTGRCGRRWPGSREGRSCPRPGLREEVPELAGHLELAPGKKYGGRFPVAPRVLAQLAVEAAIVRGHNAGHWRTARPLWTPMSAWLGESLDAAEAPRGLRRAGARAGCAASVPARPRTCSGGWAPRRRPPWRRWPTWAPWRCRSTAGRRGGCCPTTWTRSTDPGPWVALLPVLDATVMGWKGRDFYLGRHAPYALRQQRQRRHHRVGRRPDRRLLGAGRRRHGAWCTCSSRCRTTLEPRWTPRRSG